MPLSKLLASAAVVAALLPATAQAAPPWSEPVVVPGTVDEVVGAFHVLFTRTGGGALAAFSLDSASNGVTLRSALGDGAP